MITVDIAGHETKSLDQVNLDSLILQVRSDKLSYFILCASKHVFFQVALFQNEELVYETKEGKKQDIVSHMTTAEEDVRKAAEEFIAKYRNGVPEEIDSASETGFLSKLKRLFKL